MIWCTINKEYIAYLKKYDTRIPNVDYGNEKYKPFFSPLFEKMDLFMYHKFHQKKKDI